MASKAMNSVVWCGLYKVDASKLDVAGPKEVNLLTQLANNPVVVHWLQCFIAEVKVTLLLQIEKLFQGPSLTKVKLTLVGTAPPNTKINLVNQLALTAPRLKYEKFAPLVKCLTDLLDY